MPCANDNRVPEMVCVPVFSVAGRAGKREATTGGSGNERKRKIGLLRNDLCHLACVNHDISHGESSIRTDVVMTPEIHGLCSLNSTCQM